MENITVGIAELKVSKHPSTIATYGLGSCLGIALFDSRTKIIGLAHALLPLNNNSINKEKYVNTSILKLVDKMIKEGAHISNITAKIAGGSQMINTIEFMNIGKRNISVARKMLEKLKIPLISEDTGGNYARTLKLYSNDGRLLIQLNSNKKKYI